MLKGKNCKKEYLSYNPSYHLSLLKKMRLQAFKMEKLEMYI